MALASGKYPVSQIQVVPAPEAWAGQPWTLQVLVLLSYWTGGRA